MATSRLTTALTNLDATPFNGFMIAILTQNIVTTDTSTIYARQEWEFQVINGQAYMADGVTKATLPVTQSGSANPGNAPITLRQKWPGGRYVPLGSFIIPPESGGVAVNLASLIPVAADGVVVPASIFGITAKGVYDALTAYAVGQAVVYGGRTYVAILASTGQTPAPGSTYWGVFFDGIEPTLVSATPVASLAGADEIHVAQGGAAKKATLTQVLALAMAAAMTWSQPAVFSGAVTMASTLALAGDFALATNKVTMAAASGNTAIAGTLGVTGAATLASTLAVTGLATFTALPRWSALTPGSIPFASTAGQIAQNNAALFWDAANARLGVGNAAPARVLDVTGTFGATGAAVLGSTLAVAGAATLSSTLGVTGAATLGAAPTVFTTYSIGGRNERTETSGTRSNAVFEAVADPSGSTAAIHNGVVGYAEVKSGNIRPFSATAANGGGITGVRGEVRHLGSAAVQNAISLYGAAIANTGGGSIVNTIGLYLADQTAGTNNYGVYQVGAAVTNYLAGKLGIGVTTPDATAILDLRQADTQMALGSAAKNGYLGSNTSVGTHLAWRATNNAGTWTARGVAATICVQSSAGHLWYHDASGLTDGSTFTPTQIADLRANTASQATLWVAAAPTIVTNTSSAIGAMPVYTSTTVNRAAANFQSVGNPTANSSAVYYGAIAAAATETANAFDFTSTFGLRGVYARTYHRGAGVVTGAVGVLIDSVSNTGGGTITTAYGLYVSAQTAGVTNWGVHQVGTTTPNLFQGALMLGSTTGPIIKSGTGTPEGVEAAPVGSVFLRTNGAPGTTMYAKTTGAGNTGWAAVA